MGRRVVVDDLSSSQLARLTRQKSDDGFATKSWKEWLLSKAAPTVEASEKEKIRDTTRYGLRAMWGRNMGANMAFIRRKGAKSLRDIGPSKGASAIVVGGGPSIDLHNHLDVLQHSDYHGSIVACDRMLGPLLDHDIVPDYVLTVDGSDVILKYFKMQQFRRYKDALKVVAHIAISPKVTRFLYHHHVPVYWFLAHSGYVSEEEVTDSDAMVTINMTVTKHNPHGIQTLTAGGNVGVTSWAFAWLILKKPVVALIGFDMGYPEGTPLQDTYYYSQFIGATKRIMDSTSAALAAMQPFTKEYNPTLKCHTYTDPVFRSYRDLFYAFLDRSPRTITTCNCTESGSLRHPRLTPMTLARFLHEHRE